MLLDGCSNVCKGAMKPPSKKGNQQMIQAYWWEAQVNQSNKRRNPHPPHVCGKLTPKKWGNGRSQDDGDHPRVVSWCNMHGGQSPKSFIPLNWVNQLQRHMIEVFPPFMVQMFEDNLAYLCFKLKPNNYKYGDGYGSYLKSRINQKMHS